jgi:hydrogenase expression/formation protein HypC
MCQARPVQIRRVEGTLGWFLAGADERPVSLVAVDGVLPGDYVICHAGLAIERLSSEEAQEILTALAEVEAMVVADLVGENGR